MQLVRLAKATDLQDIYDLINSGAGPAPGMTTMPKTHDEIEERIDWSLKSIQKTNKTPNLDCYFFVLEEDQKVIGISAIYTSVSKKDKSIFFQRSNKRIFSQSLDFIKSIEILKLKTVNNPYTELGTLYLDSNYRGQGRGSLLSLARIKFMTLWPNRFDKKAVVEIRGKSNKDNISIFWDGFSKHFFDLEQFDSNQMSYIDNAFVAESIPDHPFVINTLKQSVKNVIGVPHDKSFPAMRMMEGQNFKANGLIDVLDGGPSLECKVKDLKIFKSNELYSVNPKKTIDSTNVALISNTKLEKFIVTRSTFELANDSIFLPQSTFDLLNLKEGDKVALNV